ncbi:MAG TPA: WecB/TagA/CpsF family glycosyltransferase [Smithellaceae bacterium]|jgi:UDP-N-acetyl-D-mannosaminouronate:lipid I N-acetyl-D-mannosaminouronosyltransferase|nr:WecB/TagA/CpsF family glycosyltransferase [Smithellaceae bacterium]
MERVYINGKSVFPFKSKEELLKFISKEKKILIAMNTEKILSSNNKLQSIINDNIAYPDGIGAVMALRRKSIKAAKIPGAYLWQDIIKQFYHDKSFYLIGSTDEVINSTVKKLKSEYPKIRIAGFRNGYFDNHEFAAILEDIKNKKPDIIFIAMGSPKQEYVMADLLSQYPALYMGLGGSFDLYSGITKPVPEWWNKIFKWEGLYRCFSDFRNIQRWKRQFPALKIIPKIIFNKL